HTHTPTPLDWRPWYTHPTPPPTTDLPTYPFQHRSYWLTGGHTGPAAPGSAPLTHPLLTATAPLADGGHLLTGHVPSADHEGWPTEHTIAGTTLLPGTALLDLALTAADRTGTPHIGELVLHRPVVLDTDGPRALQAIAGPADQTGRRTLHLYTRPRSGTAEWVHHATATLTDQPAEERPAAEAEAAWPPPGAEPVDLTGFYDRAAAHGYHYGPAYRGLRAVWRHGDDLLADIALPVTTADALAVHPALLDAALHPLIATADAADGEFRLPFSWHGITLHATGATHARVRLTAQGDHAYRLALSDTTGAPVLTAEALTTRPVDPARLRGRPGDGLYRTRWTALPVPAAAAPTAAEEWAVLGDAGAAWPPPLPRYPDVTALVAALDDGAPVPPVVLTGVPAADGGESHAVAGVLDALRQWLAEPRLAEARLVVVTRDAAAVDEGSGADPVAAAVWGLVRSAQAEHPGRFTLLDLDPEAGAGPEVVEVLGAALDADEWQVAVRGGQALVPRLTAVDPTAGIALPVGAPAWQLVVAQDGGGTVDGLVPEETPHVLEPLSAGQVRIAVRAAGINFRDVMVTLGVVPDRRGLGGEGAGVVLEVAADVTSMAPGDRVMGLFEGAFGPVAVADARTLVPVPPG
ncbi:polyketide synthase dehydratase domain-containing protein, partial [Streptomyces sp. NPDC018031]|uniref:polyketide synthase dehydratase domain-containing protein n=1 Tax=Streptomyces sp. NPDC018031 TaxID=3365033 RepID=UPI00379BD2B5